MTAPIPIPLDAADAIELVELLGFVADLCASAPGHMNRALRRLRRPRLRRPRPAPGRHQAGRAPALQRGVRRPVAGAGPMSRAPADDRGSDRRGGDAVSTTSAQVRARASPRGGPHRPGAALGPGRDAAVLLVAEVEGRDRSTIEAKRRKARFPAGKTFESWIESSFVDPGGRPNGRYAASSGSPGRRIWWSPGRAGRERAICSRPSATAPSSRGMTVAWFSVEDLGAIVRRHRVDDTVSKTFASLAAVALTVVDDIGLLPISQDAAEGLYRLVDASYERRSLALSSNLHPSGFDQLMDKTIASALVDRLMHHAHVIVTDGESVRLADAISGKGVVSFTLSPSHHTVRGDPRGRPRGKPWPSAGSSRGRPWGNLMAVRGEFWWPPVGRSRWPLTPRFCTPRSHFVASGNLQPRAHPEAPRLPFPGRLRAGVSGLEKRVRGSGATPPQDRIPKGTGGFEAW